MDGIKNFPIRFPELGRLRLGEKETFTNDRGQEAERPKKLDTWRITSHDDVTLKAVASIYGGEVVRWTDAPGGDQWEVVTETSAVDVLIPSDPLDMRYERWGAGGRQRRCDGETCLVPLQNEGTDGAHFEEQNCWCLTKGLTPGDAESVKKGACDLVLRVKVVLPDVPGLGVFVLTTGSIYAAMEMPAQLQLLANMHRSGNMVPASLAIEQRQEKKAWEKYPRKYPVPVLRVRRSMRELAELGNGDGPPELDPPRTSRRRSSVADLPPTNQSVIYASSEQGLSDDEAHALCRLVSNGRTGSRKELRSTECALFLGHLGTEDWREAVRNHTAEHYQGVLEQASAETAETGEEVAAELAISPRNSIPTEVEGARSDVTSTRNPGDTPSANVGSPVPVDPASTHPVDIANAPTAKRKRSYADDIHAMASNLGLKDEELDAIIYFTSSKSTTSAKEITPAQAGKVVNKLQAIQRGDFSTEEIAAAVEAWKKETAAA